jgi:hypothetical protein
MAGVEPGLDRQIIQSSREARLYALVLPLLTRRWV